MRSVTRNTSAWDRLDLCAPTNRHCLGRCRSFVQQRSTGHRKSCQIGNQGLKVEQGLEPSLRDFSLYGVYCVYQPGFSRMFASNDRWHNTRVESLTNEACCTAVGGRHAAEFLEGFRLVEGFGQRWRLGQVDGFGHRLLDKRFKAVHLERCQHRCRVRVPGPKWRLRNPPVVWTIMPRSLIDCVCGREPACRVTGCRVSLGFAIGANQPRHGRTSSAP